MGFLSRVSTIVSPPKMRASTMSDYNQAFWSGADMADAWVASLSAAGVTVTPDLAMTLSAVYCAVSTISYDLGTLPLRAFKVRTDGGQDLVLGTARSHDGISSLVYKLQWQPNAFQSAAEFFIGQIAQLLLRGKSYAEIVDGPSAAIEQLLPRHPDRVFPERLPSGRIRYRLTEADGSTRYVTQDEMHVVRDLSTDGLNSLSRTSYASSAFGTGLAAERAAGKFFKSGMTAATVATYTGEMDDEAESALHKSISRYAAGVDNSFGLMLIPDDVKISNLAIEPDKAQMMLAREWTVFEVARYYRISPRKLMVRTAGAAGYGSAYQDSIDHVVNCLRTYAVPIQQAIKRDLIIAQDAYSFVFHLGELLKGDPAQMGTFIQQLISSRAMTPSEVRMTFLDLNPSPELDRLSEGDNRPGSPKNAAPVEPQQNARALRDTLALHDDAIRCLRRERAAVQKLAKQHASDVVAWKAGLRDFYGEHAGFVAQTMRLQPTVARGYAAQHGSEFESKGVVLIDGADGAEWERREARELTALALANGDQIERWFQQSGTPDPQETI